MFHIPEAVVIHMLLTIILNNPIKKQTYRIIGPQAGKLDVRKSLPIEVLLMLSLPS